MEGEAWLSPMGPMYLYADAIVSTDPITIYSINQFIVTGSLLDALTRFTLLLPILLAWQGCWAGHSEC